MEALLKILRDQAISFFGKEVCDKLEGFALRVKDCKSTREVQVLRREVLDFLRLKQPQPEGKDYTRKFRAVCKTFSFNR